MTWEWSHAPEAHSNVRDNIADMPHEWLVIVWAEWKTHGASARTDEGDADIGDEAFDKDKYNAFLAEAEDLPDDCMADDIYEWASTLRNCTNGGWEAHCCPYGCGCHMVPFDRPIEIPPDFPVQPVKKGEKAKEPATCGTCGLTWDDAVSTGYTPVPSGRCPFEEFHR